MVAAIISVIAGFIESLIALRFVLRLVGANPGNEFVGWVYDWSTPLVAPFAGVFGQNANVAGPGLVVQGVLDWTALIALVVYGLAAGLILRLVGSSR